MVKKNKIPDDEDWEEFDLEEDNEDDEIFTCRVCGEEFTYETGDDYVLICDKCAEDFNMDQLWSDFDTEKLKEEELKTVDLELYRYKI